MEETQAGSREAVRVREATPADLELLVAGNLALAEESEGRRLDESVLEAGVAAVLADPARGRYLAAERGGELAGQLLLTWEWSDWRNGWFWWIQSVYTWPWARRSGVYRALYTEVGLRARARGDVRGLRLYVARENEIAQRVYDRLGMPRAAYLLHEGDWS